MPFYVRLYKYEKLYKMHEVLYIYIYIYIEATIS